MKSQPLTSRQIISCCVGGIIGFILAMGFITGSLQNYLAELPIPLRVLIIICVILFCIWLFGATFKNLVIASYSKTASSKEANFVDTPFNEVSLADTQIDMEKLGEWDAALQILGFKPIKDFSTSNLPITVVGRLLINEEHQCLAEIFSAFPSNIQNPSLPLICAISSDLNDSKASATNQLGLATVNNNLNAKSALEWALRDSLSLWSYHPDWSPKQLFSFPLTTRKEISQVNQLKPVTGLSWEEYCKDSIIAVQRRRKRLLRKPGLILWFECSFCKNKTEWWGDYRKVMNKAS
jgi:hypothetical protein